MATGPRFLMSGDKTSSFMNCKTMIIDNIAENSEINKVFGVIMVFFRLILQFPGI